MHGRLATGIVSVVGALVCSAVPAHAHSPVEITKVVSYSEHRLVLATNRGLILGQLAPRAFSLLCVEALPVPLDGSYRVVQLRSGRLLLSSTAGLQHSDDGGCTWGTLSALATIPITDMVLHPEDPSTVFVTTAGLGQVAVRVSDDGGSSFRTLIALSDAEYVRSLVVSVGPPVSIHVAGYRAPLSAADAHFVLSSSDGGATWSRFSVPLLEGERDLTLLSAHPASPGVVVARATAARPELGERALVSRDGGRSFASVATLRLLRSATFGADGNELLLAGVDGVFTAPLSAPTAMKLGESAWISHTQRLEQAVVACGYYDGIDAPRNGIAALSPSGFVPWFSFAEVREVTRCPEPSLVAAKCQAAMKDFRLENQKFEVPTVSVPHADAGTLAPPGMDADASPTPSAASAVDAGPGTQSETGALLDATVGGSEPVLGDASSQPLAPASMAAQKSRGGCALADAPGSHGLTIVLLVLGLMARGRRARRQP